MGRTTAKDTKRMNNQPAPPLDVQNIWAAFQYLTKSFDQFAAITTAALEINKVTIGALGPEYEDDGPVPEHVGTISQLSTLVSNAAVAAMELVEQAQDRLLMEMPGALVATMGGE